MTGPAPQGGLLAALRRLLAGGVEMLRVRLELLGTEIEQEKLRLFDAVLWAGLALLFRIMPSAAATANPPMLALSRVIATFSSPMSGPLPPWNTAEIEYQ